MKMFLFATAVSILAMAVASRALEYRLVDADHDGRVTLEEARAAIPEISTAVFVAADTDGDGVLSASEFETLASR